MDGHALTGVGSGLSLCLARSLLIFIHIYFGSDQKISKIMETISKRKISYFFLDELPHFPQICNGQSGICKINGILRSNVPFFVFFRSLKQ